MELRKYFPNKYLFATLLCNENAQNIHIFFYETSMEIIKVILNIFPLAIFVKVKKTAAINGQKYFSDLPNRDTKYAHAQGSV